MSKQITLTIKDNKYSDFLELIKNLDFVKIDDLIKPEPAQKEITLSHTDIIFGTGKPATDSQLKKYLSDSDSEETKELSMVCEDVIAYLDKDKK